MLNNNMVKKDKTPHSERVPEGEFRGFFTRDISAPKDPAQITLPEKMDYLNNLGVENAYSLTTEEVNREYSGAYNFFKTHEEDIKLKDVGYADTGRERSKSLFSDRRPGETCFYPDFAREAEYSRKGKKTPTELPAEYEWSSSDRGNPTVEEGRRLNSGRKGKEIINISDGYPVNLSFNTRGLLKYVMLPDFSPLKGTPGVGTVTVFDRNQHDIGATCHNAPS